MNEKFFGRKSHFAIKFIKSLNKIIIRIPPNYTVSLLQMTSVTLDDDYDFWFSHITETDAANRWKNIISMQVKKKTQKIEIKKSANIEMLKISFVCTNMIHAHIINSQKKKKKNYFLQTSYNI